jgi:trehalose/maltose hydrolase-like predicted phosphorylase
MKIEERKIELKTVSLKIIDDAIEMSFTSNQVDAQPQQIMVNYDADQTIGENLENIRVKLVGIQFDAIVIENPLMYHFSDTIVGLHHQRIDIGLALTNMFNVPVLALPTIKKVGLAKALQQKQAYNSWHLDYYGQYQGKRNYGQEAMLTIGNGFFGLRGAYVESRADADNYPGLYVAGVYNQNTTTINGRDVVNEDLVNLPNAQALAVGIDHENPFKIRHSNIRDIYRSLDLKTGRLTTTLMVGLSTGHQMMVRATKVADMRNWHRFTIRYEVTPLNFAGSLQVTAAIDGSVINGNVERYAQFDQHHFDVTGMASAANQALLTGVTKTSNVQFVIGSQLTSPQQDLTNQVTTTTAAKALKQTVDLDVQPGQTYTVDKNVTIFTSRESERASLEDLTWAELSASTYADTAQSTAGFYQKVWQQADFQITGDTIGQKLSRVNVFHLFVTGTALASDQLDASVGARGLHGEAYRGHVFWDEMFVMPFYATQTPKIARAMLCYRYRRLDAARAYAASEGQQGAMYPWQSGMKGDEQSQFVHLNPLTNQ